MSTNGPRNPILQKKMFYTSVMEKLVSHKAVSGELNVACGVAGAGALCLVISLPHMLRPFPLRKFAIWRDQILYGRNIQNAGTFEQPCAREDSPCLALLSSHGSIKELNISHSHFLPAQCLWLMEYRYIYNQQLFFQLTFKPCSHPCSWFSNIPLEKERKRTHPLLYWVLRWIPIT